jgi:rod shape-determining protein MreC
VGDYLTPGIPIGRIWGGVEPRDGFTPQSVASGAHLTQLYNLQILLAGGPVVPLDASN